MPKTAAISKSIYVTTSFIAFHCWPEAPEEVSFLRSKHRHKFGVRACFRITEDRQLEFFLVQSEVNSICQHEIMPALKERRSLSCESMALMIYNSLVSKGLPVTEVEVNEDGENGSIIKTSA